MYRYPYRSVYIISHLLLLDLFKIVEPQSTMSSSLASLALRISPRTASKRTRSPTEEPLEEDVGLGSQFQGAESCRKSAVSVCDSDSPPSLLKRLENPIDDPVVPSPIRLLDRIHRMDPDETWDVARGQTRTPLIERLSLPKTDDSPVPVDKIPLENRLSDPQPANDVFPRIEVQEDGLTASHLVTDTTMPSAPLTRPRPSADPDPPSQAPQSQTDTVESTLRVPELLSAASPDSEDSVAGFLRLTGSPDECHDMDESFRGYHDKPATLEPLTELNDAARSPRAALRTGTIEEDVQEATGPFAEQPSPNTEHSEAPSDTPSAMMFRTERIPAPDLTHESISDVPPPNHDAHPAPEGDHAHSGVAPKLTSDVTPRDDMDVEVHATTSGNESQDPISDVLHQPTPDITTLPDEPKRSRSHPRSRSRSPTPRTGISSTDDLTLDEDVALLNESMNAYSTTACSNSIVPHESIPILTTPDTPLSPDSIIPATQTGSIDAHRNTPPTSVPPPIPSNAVITIPVANPVVIEQFRAALIPVIIQNAALRRGHTGRQPTADQVRAFLSDQRCAELLAKSKAVREQLASRDASNPTGTDVVAQSHSSESTERPNDVPPCLPHESRAGKGESPPSHDTFHSPIPPSSISPTTITVLPTSSESPSGTALPLVPMRRHDVPHRYPSVSLDYGPADPPVPPEPPSSSTHSPPPPYAERTEEQGVLKDVDPVSHASESRGAKRVRRTNADDVHTAISWPSHHSSPSSLAIGREAAPLANKSKLRQDHSIAPHAQPQTGLVSGRPPSQEVDTMPPHEQGAGPSRPVPGVWLAKVGLDQPDILDLSLDIGVNVLHNP